MVSGPKNQRNCKRLVEYMPNRVNVVSKVKGGHDTYLNKVFAMFEVA